MHSARIPKIRPVSWKIFVQGELEAEYVRSLLHEMNIYTNMPEREPGLVEPALWSFVASASDASPTTSEELEAILRADHNVELLFQPA